MTALTDAFKEKLLNGGGLLTTNTIQAYLVDEADHTFDAAHATLSDLDVASRVAGPVTLTSPTIAGGVFDTADFVFPSVSGDGSEAVVLIDATDDVYIGIWNGLSLTPNGNNINGTVNASGWFAL